MASKITTPPAYIYPSDLFGTKYGKVFCLITVLDTYAATDTDAVETIKNTSGNVVSSIARGDFTQKGKTSRQSLNSTRRVKENIFLPMPLSFSTNYGVSYDDSFSYIEEGKQAISGVLDSGSDAIGALAKNFPITSSLGKLLGSVTPSALKIGGAAAGLALNPHKELLFNGVKFREFKFKYKLIAKSEKESEMINKIIKIFEKYMHPTLDAKSFLYRYPAEFEIRFFTSDGQQNKFIYKIYRSVLQNYTVSYGGNNFVTFKNKDGKSIGAPVEIEIELDFKETNPLTRDFIEEILNKENLSSTQAVLPS